jgi:hypothetical protein
MVRELINFLEDGTKEYRSHGQLHREDGPAIITKAGDEYWYYDGFPHRLNGPAITKANGYEEYRLYGQVHRDDGPAILWADGTKQWYKEGIKHRLKGPAVLYPSGNEEWWVNGKEVPRSSIKSEKLKMLGD